MMRRREVRWLLAALALAARGAGAQEAPPRFDASPLLPEAHWAVRAAARAEALGLAPEYFPAQRAVPRAAVAAALETAALRAEAGSPLSALAEGWRARFVEEFPEYGGGEPTGLTCLRAGAAAGYMRHEGRLSPATGYADTRADPEPLPSRDAMSVRASAGAALGRRLAAHAEASADERAARIGRWEVVAAAGPVTLSAGRAELGYGPGHAGGVVLSTGSPMGRIEAQTTRPFRLPGPARVLGSVSAHTFAARMDGARHPQRPWLWGARVAARPHSRLTVGVSRASMFGGDSVPTTLGRIAGMLVGVLSEDFENQIVAVDARWRLPTDALLPATAYLEWGAEDASGAWRSQPGQLAGLHLPTLPGAPWASLGVEGARFARCCGHGAWYTHFVFRGNWAQAEAPLAHPLGGEGHEAAAYGEMEGAASAVRLEWRVFVRDRSDWTLDRLGGGNLYVPARAGTSRGVQAAARVRLAADAALRAALYRESGASWREQRLETEIELRF